MSNSISTPANRVHIVFINRHRLATTVDNNNIRAAGRLFRGLFYTPRARILEDNDIVRKHFSRYGGFLLSCENS